jgi:hypothetical protein
MIAGGKEVTRWFKVTRYRRLRASIYMAEENQYKAICARFVAFAENEEKEARFYREEKIPEFADAITRNSLAADIRFKTKYPEFGDYREDFARHAALHEGFALGWRELASRWRQQADSAAGLRRKYERGARVPWAHLGPDPPPEDLFRRAWYWMDLREFDRALADFTEYARCHPDSKTALECLAWFFATTPDAKYRDGKRAVDLATRACELSGWRDCFALDTLAAAYAECRAFRTAVKWEQSAIERSIGDPRFLKVGQRRLALYRAGHPFRWEPPAACVDFR